MQTKALLKPNYLHACSIIAAKHDIRWYLNSVRVEVGVQETIYAACDGHKLLVIRDQRTKMPEQHPVSITIPLDTVFLIPKKFKVPTLGVDLHYDTESTNTECRLGDVFFKPCDGKFPDWRKVIPREVTGERSTYNPQYLMHFGKAAGIAYGPGQIPEFWSNGQGAGLVLISHCDDFVGVVMPVREQSIGAVPAWIKPADPAPAPQAVEAPAAPVAEPANAEPAMAAAD